MKQFGNPPLSKRTPPFQLTPYFWAIFSWPPSLSKFQKQEPPPFPPLHNFSGGGDYGHSLYFHEKVLKNVRLAQRYLEFHFPSGSMLCQVGKSYTRQWWPGMSKQTCYQHWIRGWGGTRGRRRGCEFNNFCGWLDDITWNLK